MSFNFNLLKNSNTLQYLRYDVESKLKFNLND